MCMFCFFFFKQKTAYEMRISDWSSDVCSSDLARQGRQLVLPPFLQVRAGALLELHGDFAIPIGRQGKAFLGLHLAARIVERTIQLTPRPFPTARQFLPPCNIRPSCAPLAGKQIVPHITHPLGLSGAPPPPHL